MRFLHNEVALVVAFIESRALQLYDCDVVGGWNPRRVEAAALEVYLTASHKLWGEGPKHFFYATSGRVPPDFGLRTALARAESTSDEIALCAYADGGIISVTREIEEFQKTARDASWWVLRRWPPERKI